MSQRWLSSSYRRSVGSMDVGQADQTLGQCLIPVLAMGGIPPMDQRWLIRYLPTMSQPLHGRANSRLPVVR